METLSLFAGGILAALQPANLLFALAGCVIGTVVGILPGIGPVAGTAILIPLTMTLDPTQAIIMLAAIYYGAMYGGTLTSVLVNVPGEAASAITCLDGHAMAKQGRAGAALAIAAIGSFIGGTIASMGLVWLALPLSSFALRFGPPEFFALMVVGLSLVTGLASTSLIRALLSATFGLMIAMVGIDPVVGGTRFTFGQTALLDGINVVSVAMGLFGIGEILLLAETSAVQIFDTKIRSLMPSKQDWKESWAPILRGTGIGFFIGLIPGIGAVVPTIFSYITEKKLSPTPEKFGTGMIAGVAGPETANNAYSNASLLPLFTLGIPGSPTVAIIMGAFMMNGLIPGPLLFKEHSDLVWTVIGSLFVGNLILILLNLPLIPLWVLILKAPRSVLCTLILGFCVVGAYSLNGNAFDIVIMGVFGVLGYAFRKLDIPLAPMVLTVILGPMMEKALRQSLEISRGSFEIFFTRPISVTLLIIAAIFVLASTRRFAAQARGGDTEV